MEKYAIVGFGCAGYNGLVGMRAAGFQGEIHIYSELSDPPASPMLTTYYVSDSIPREGLYPFGSLEEIAEQYGAVIHSDCRVTGLEPDSRTIELENGERSQFDKILIATGAEPVKPDLGLEHSKRIFYMRSVEDAEQLKEVLNRHMVESAVVVGGSMVGIKVAELLNKRGIHVLLMDMAKHIFSTAAYDNVAEEIERRVTEKGISLDFGSGITQAMETEDAILTCLDNGKVSESDILVLCVGTRARVELARGTGIQIGRGIVVGDDMQTSVPGIYAAGDCCEGRNIQGQNHQIIGLWANAGYQGETAGRAMAGEKAEFTGNILHNLTHFLGMDFISFGDIHAEGEVRCFGTLDDPTYIQVTLKDNKIVCINVLDEYQVSGIIRNYMINVLAGAEEPMSPALKGYLAQVDMEQEFLDLFATSEEEFRHG